jgi:hypothetical protein
MTTNDSILVLGAGELGMSVLRHLAKRTSQSSKTTISVLLRSATINSDQPEKRRDVDELRSRNVGVLPGDLSAASPEELSALVAPFHTVISCTGFVGGTGTQRKIAQAVLAAGVRRFVPWQFGVDYDLIGRGSAQDLFDEQLDVRDLLRSQQATEWVIISTGMFTSFLFEPSFGVVDLHANEVHALGSFETAVTVTGAEDIGALTADIVFADPRIVDRVVYTAGDTITYGHLADLLDSSLGLKLHRSEWSLTHLREELAHDPQSAIKKYRVVFAEGKGVFWPLSQTFNAQNGIATQNVADWLSSHRKQLTCS